MKRQQSQEESQLTGQAGKSKMDQSMADPQFNTQRMTPQQQAYLQQQQMKAMQGRPMMPPQQQIPPHFQFPGGGQSPMPGMHPGMFQPGQMHYSQQQQMQQQQQANQNQLLGTIDIRNLTQRISSKEVLDQQVEKILTQISEDFVKNVAEFSCKLAKHRGSDTLEKEDIKFAIEKLYNIPAPIKPTSEKQYQQIQGLSSASLGQASTANYKHNLALVKKANEQNNP